MDEESLKLFFDSWMRGRIEELVLHEQGYSVLWLFLSLIKIFFIKIDRNNLGNFLLQRVFTKSSDNLFDILLKQLGALGSLKQAWINNKGGILARIAERAVKSSEEVQAHVMTHLTSAVCLSDKNIAKALLVETG